MAAVKAAEEATEMAAEEATEMAAEEATEMVAEEATEMAAEEATAKAAEEAAAMVAEETTAKAAEEATEMAAEEATEMVAEEATEAMVAAPAEAEGKPTCPQCGKEVAAGSKFCKVCGATVPYWEVPVVDQGLACPQCGKVMSAGAKFCKACGTVIPQVVQKKPKSRLLMILIPAVGLFLVIALMIGLFWVSPAIKYNQAMDMMAAGAYPEAMVAFAELEDFKDSPQKVLECEYAYGLKLMEMGAYPEAISVFAFLGNYQDCPAQIIECNYRAAVDLLESGKYPEAIEAFTKLDGYRDSKELIKECDYRTNLKLLEDGKYTEAMAGFTELGDYKDSADQVKECRYQMAIRLIGQGKVVEGYDELVALGNYKDSVQRVSNLSDTYQMIKAKPNLMVNDYWGDGYSGMYDMYTTVVDTNTIRVTIYRNAYPDDYYVEWNFTCRWEESTGRWNYSGGKMKETTYYPFGGSWTSDSYSNGSGYLYYKNGYVYWVDYKRNAGSGLSFTRRYYW